MNAMWLVAVREYTERLRNRTFLISNAAIIVLILITTVLPQVFFHGDETTPVGYIGPDAEQVATLAVAQQAAFDLELELVDLTDRAEAEAALAADEVDAVLLDHTTALADGNLARPLEALLANAANGVAIDGALTTAGLDPAERAELFAIEPLTVQQVDDTDALDLFDPSIIVVFMAVFMLYGLLALYGQWVAQGIVEEKQSRVVEVLLATVRPTELLAGKIAGLGALGLTQILLMVGVGATAVVLTGVVEVPRAAWGALALVIPWFILGFLLYATLFAVAGAVVSRVEDVQASTMPVIAVLIIALLGAQFTLSDPTSTVATIAGIVPLTAPIVQPILYAFGLTSAAEVVLAIVLAIAATALMVPLAGRIYSGGILRTRGRVSLREAWSSAR